MKYAEELEKAGLHKAVSCIVRQFPHLEKLAENDARSFAQDACHLTMVPGTTLKDYWKLSGIALGKIHELL